MSEDKSVDPAVAAAGDRRAAGGGAAQVRDGKVACAALRKLAEDNDVPYKVAGAAADMDGIKVRDCDLGCF